MTGRLRLRIAAVSHRGLVRERNEDAVGIAGWVLRSDAAEPWRLDVDDGVEVLVADGMGGHSGGETASSLAVGTFAGAAGTWRDRLGAADAALAARASEEPDLRRMGTTLAGVTVTPGGEVHVFGVGDTRVYRVVEGYLGLLTVDDRVPVGGGSALTQHLGPSRRAALAPHEFRFDAQPGDRLLVCTDGVHDVLDDDAIAELLDRGPTLGIRDAVLAAGAPDNLTYVTVEVLSTSP